MVFFSNCVNHIRTIPSQVHDDIKVEDLDSDGEDHAADETRYAVMSRPGIDLTAAQAELDAYKERQRLEQHWQQRRERAAFEAERAARQYAAVEPENRLVARELERRWEAALGEQRRVEEAYDRFCQEQPAELTAAQREAIVRLAEDVPRLWHAATTMPQDRQEILRLLLEQVTVTVEGESEQVAVTLHWAGGHVSQHRLIRPVARYEQLSYYAPLRARVATLQAQGCSSREIARYLNAEGFLPPKRTNRFTAPMVTRFLIDEGLHVPRPQAAVNGRLLRKHERWLTELAVRLNIPLATLHKWQRMGWLRSRKVSQAGGRWAIWADEAELTRLRQLRVYRRQWPEPRYPKELTTPGSFRKPK
jgi:hypothetical protein